VKILPTRWFRGFKDVSNQHFEFPLRIKTAGIISSGFVAISGLVVKFMQVILWSYEIYKVIDKLQGDLDYLRKEPLDNLFIIIRLQNVYTETVDDGKKIIIFLIDLLNPIFPCVVIGYVGGFALTSVSIYSMFYVYKRKMLKIRAEGNNSETLKTIWKISPYNSILFCGQFIANSFFLCNLLATALFIACYLVSFKWTREFFFDFVKARPPAFWISLVPSVLG
jgi:hypothetical protein